MSLVDPAAVAQGVPVLVDQGAGSVAVLVESVPSLAGQTGPGGSTGGESSDPLVDALVSVVVTLVVGGILLALAPEGSRDIVRKSRERPLYAAVAGFLGFFGGLIAFVLLGITVVGLVVSIPGFIAWILIALAGSAYGAMVVGSLVTDATDLDGLGPALVIGAVAMAAVGLVPALGELVTLVVGSIGMGSIFMFAFGSWGGGKPSSRIGGNDGSPPRDSEGYDTGYVRRGSDDGSTDRRGWK
ncbi:hypothetical protein BRD00_04275 [Halobacteriales archaeon QS_8_69_26]|nr:MAG: hypothetical protein BRD00_04275 [Halobacteriales archaeon QS_8_69_26]